MDVGWGHEDANAVRISNSLFSDFARDGIGTTVTDAIDKMGNSKKAEACGGPLFRGNWVVSGQPLVKGAETIGRRAMLRGLRL